MKSQTYFRFALTIPLILWIICSIISWIISGQGLSPLGNTILTPIIYYALGIILWFIPYTILVIGMWIWTGKKDVPALRKAGLTAPIIFYLLMLAETSVVYLASGSVGELKADFPGLAAMLAAFSLVFGYLCVSIAFGVFKLLQGRNFILQEIPAEH